MGTTWPQHPSGTKLVTPDTLARVILAGLLKWTAGLFGNLLQFSLFRLKVSALLSPLSATLPPDSLF